MSLTVAEIETKIAHLEHAVTHLLTYGQVEAAKVIEEVIAEAKAHLASLPPIAPAQDPKTDPANGDGTAD